MNKLLLPLPMGSIIDFLFLVPIDKCVFSIPVFVARKIFSITLSATPGGQVLWAFFFRDPKCEFYEKGIHYFRSLFMVDPPTALVAGVVFYIFNGSVDIGQRIVCFWNT